MRWRQAPTWSTSLRPTETVGLPKPSSGRLRFRRNVQRIESTRRRETPPAAVFYVCDPGQPPRHIFSPRVGQTIAFCGLPGRRQTTKTDRLPHNRGATPGRCKCWWRSPSQGPPAICRTPSRPLRFRRVERTDNWKYLGGGRSLQPLFLCVCDPGHRPPIFPAACGADDKRRWSAPPKPGLA